MNKIEVQRGMFKIQTVRDERIPQKNYIGIFQNGVMIFHKTLDYEMNSDQLIAYLNEYIREVHKRNKENK